MSGDVRRNFLEFAAKLADIVHGARVDVQHHSYRDGGGSYRDQRRKNLGFSLATFEEEVSRQYLRENGQLLFREKQVLVLDVMETEGGGGNTTGSSSSNSNVWSENSFSGLGEFQASGLDESASSRTLSSSSSAAKRTPSEGMGGGARRGDDESSVPPSPPTPAPPKRSGGWMDVDNTTSGSLDHTSENASAGTPVSGGLRREPAGFGWDDAEDVSNVDPSNLRVTSAPVSGDAMKSSWYGGNGGRRSDPDLVIGGAGERRGSTGTSPRAPTPPGSATALSGPLNGAWPAGQMSSSVSSMRDSLSSGRPSTGARDAPRKRILERWILSFQPPIVGKMQSSQTMYPRRMDGGFPG